MKDLFTPIIAILTAAIVITVFALFGSYDLGKALMMIGCLVVCAISYVVGYRACQKDLIGK